MKCLHLFLNCSPPTFCSPFILLSISTFSSPLSIRATPSASRFALLIPHYDPLSVRPTIARALIALVANAESSTERVRPCVRNSGKSFSLPNKIFRGKARAAGQLSDDVEENDGRKAREVSRGSREFDGRSIPEIERDSMP